MHAWEIAELFGIDTRRAIEYKPAADERFDIFVLLLFNGQNGV